MSTSDASSGPHFIATLVRGHRYDLGGVVFEAGIPRPCSASERRYLETHAVIPADNTDGDPVCLFDFAEDATPVRSREMFPLRRAAARNARLGDYTTPTEIDAARIAGFPKK